MSRPTLLFYCQHSVGMGHLVRSLTLAEALASSFDVVLLSGGALPHGMAPPPGVRIMPLPPLGHGDDYALVSRDPRWTVERAQRERSERIVAEFGTLAPRVIIVELYPFGRRKFAFELLPLLEAARASADPPLVLCSLRDILVASRRDQARHDQQACDVANRFFDAIVVHADPRFARLEESFQPRTPLDVPVHYTGFIRRPSTLAVAGRANDRIAPRVCVSAGGGLVGGPLFAAAADAAPAVHAEFGLATTIVTGPFLPTRERATLDATARRVEDRLRVVEFVPDLAAEIAASAVSVSQCGYNTTMDLLTAGTPAVVVPYAEGREDEQRRRASRLETLGAVTVLDPSLLSAATLLDSVDHALAAGPSGVPDLRLDGRERTVALVEELATTGAVPSDAGRTR